MAVSKPGDGTHYSFANVHHYDPPIEMELAELQQPLEAGASTALRLMLPEPPNGDQQDQAFFYRLESGRIVGDFNRCTHITIPLDFDDGNFLDKMGFVMCRVHGARYDLETGERCAGPARGNLTRILCEEVEGRLRILGWEKVR